MTSTDRDITPSDEKLRIDRRTAMKAALGGAAAAVALTAPRIEGFSIAPDFAAAASQCPPDSQVGGTIPLTTMSPGCNTCSLCCWGTVDHDGCLPGNCHDHTVPGNVTVPVSSDNFDAPMLTAVVKGQVKRKPGALNAGKVTLTLSDFTLNEPYKSCTVAISGSCTGNGIFHPQPVDPEATSVRTQSNSWDTNIWCTKGGTTPLGTVTIAMTCLCGPD